MLARSSDAAMTVGQFLKAYEGVDGRYELVDGHVRSVCGLSAAHSIVSGNLLILLRQLFRGTTHRPFNSGVGLWLSDATLRYPDVTVCSDPRDLELNPDVTQSFRYPSIVFEVLSPATEIEDRAVKALEYKSIATVEAIVLVDPVARTLEVHERIGAQTWLHRLPAAGIDLVLKKPPMTLAHADIFDLN